MNGCHSNTRVMISWLFQSNGDLSSIWFHQDGHVFSRLFRRQSWRMPRTLLEQCDRLLCYAKWLGPTQIHPFGTPRWCTDVLDWICLTVTHISRPTWVDVSDSCFQSLNKLIKPDHIVQVRGLIYCQKWYQFWDDSCGGLYRISGHSYQTEESCFSREFHYASLKDCLKERIQWVSCVVFITAFL